MSSFEEETGVTIVVILPWVYDCGYVCICVGSGARSLVVRCHMFVQREQGGYECCWIWYRLIKVWIAKWWRVWCHRQRCANFCV